MWGRSRIASAAAALLCLTAAGAGAASGVQVPRAGQGGAPPAASGAREVVANGGAVYLVDAAQGTVQWVDEASLAPRGRVHSLGGPIERPVVDPEGVLWASVVQSGRIIGVHRDDIGEPVDVAEPGTVLQLTMAGGILVATDQAASSVLVFDGDGVPTRLVVELGEKTVGPGRLTVPEYTESPYLPLLGNRPWRSGVLPVLVTVDLRNGRSTVRRVANGLRSLEAPHAVGDRVFVADGSQYRILEFLATSPETAVPAVLDLPARRALDFQRKLRGQARLRSDVPMTVRHGDMFHRRTHLPAAAAG